MYIICNKYNEVIKITNHSTKNKNDSVLIKKINSKRTDEKYHAIRIHNIFHLHSKAKFSQNIFEHSHI
jgi:hypothetical protein